MVRKGWYSLTGSANAAATAPCGSAAMRCWVPAKAMAEGTAVLEPVLEVVTVVEVLVMDDILLKASTSDVVFKA